MDAIHIIKAPLVTEKTTFSSNEHNRYAFAVAPGARKDEIKKAIEDLYKVRVVSVSTMNRRGANRRYRYGLVKGKIDKRAIVRIHPDDRIELF